MDWCIGYKIIDYGSMRKIILITGCSSGFGLISAARLSSLGYTVYASIRDLSKSSDLKI